MPHSIHQKLNIKAVTILSHPLIPLRIRSPTLDIIYIMCHLPNYLLSLIIIYTLNLIIVHLLTIMTISIRILIIHVNIYLPTLITYVTNHLSSRLSILMLVYVITRLSNLMMIYVRLYVKYPLLILQTL